MLEIQSLIQGSAERIFIQAPFGRRDIAFDEGSLQNQGEPDPAARVRQRSRFTRHRKIVQRKTITTKADRISDISSGQTTSGGKEGQCQTRRIRDTETSTRSSDVQGMASEARSILQRYSILQGHPFGSQQTCSLSEPTLSRRGEATQLKKEFDRSASNGSCVENEIPQISKSRQCDRRSEDSDRPSLGPQSDDSYLLYGLEEIVPSRYMPPATDVASSDDERNILAMPVHLDAGNQGEISQKYRIRDGSNIQRPYNEGSYFIQKENYIISNQLSDNKFCPDSVGGLVDFTNSYSNNNMNSFSSRPKVRLPQDIIKEEVSLIEDLSGRSKMRLSSAIEIVENVRNMKFTMACAVLFLVILPVAAGAWFFLMRPTVFTSAKRNVSLLRCFIEYVYDAMLDIYQ